MDLNRWLDDHRLVVCVGSGGVGKTTTAASLGLWAAARGRKVMVLTIDPAKRLANSLGLSRFAHEGTRIDLTPLGCATTGELWAMMLDSQRTFDELIARVAPSDEMRERILANHIYQHMSSAFAGSQDYMATEKLYDLVTGGEFDLIVLDTPPVKNALDFLESPGRLVQFLDAKILEWFLGPARNKGIGSWLAGTSALVLRMLASLFGSDFIDDLTEFVRDFEALYDGFKKRHDEVLALFRRPDTTFLTVCAPTESSVEIACFFQEELARRELPRGGVVVNQIHRCEESSHDARAVLGPVAEALGQDLPERTVGMVLARLGMAHRRLQELSIAQHAIVEGAHAAARGGHFYQEVPRLDTEVNDLTSLFAVGRHLFETPAEPMRPGATPDPD